MLATMATNYWQTVQAFRGPGAFDGSFRSLVPPSCRFIGREYASIAARLGADRTFFLVVFSPMWAPRPPAPCHTRARGCLCISLSSSASTAHRREASCLGSPFEQDANVISKKLSNIPSWFPVFRNLLLPPILNHRRVHIPYFVH